MRRSGRFSSVAALTLATLLPVAAGCGASGPAVKAISSSRTVGVAVPNGAVIFTDPQGMYTMLIDPAWTPVSGEPGNITEVWRTGIEQDGAVATVNVMSQSFADAELTEFMKRFSPDAKDYALVDARVVVESDGNDHGVAELSTRLNDRDVHLLVYVDVVDGRVSGATLTAAEALFPQARAEIEPYLRSLHATP